MNENTQKFQRLFAQNRSENQLPEFMFATFRKETIVQQMCLVLQYLFQQISFAEFRSQDPYQRPNITKFKDFKQCVSDS